MREVRLSSGMPRWQGIVLLLLTAWLYATILTRLFLQWVGPAHDPNFEHGIFVPLFALFVLWQDRERLKAIPSAPSWAGLPLFILSLLTLVLGVLGAENFLSRVSLLILLAGMILLFRGWEFFRAVLFPWAFLILMIPLPNIIVQPVTFPLQLFAARVSTEMLRLVGVPVLREGNMIMLARLPLDVAEACSGIRSLLTLVTLAIIYGYLLETRIWVRVLLVFCAVPIAVAANSFRVFGTGLLVQFWDPDKAEGFFHTFQGLVIFAVALVLLFAVHRVISLIWKNSPTTTPLAQPAVRQSEGASQAVAGGPRFWVAAVLMLTTATGLQAHSHNENFPPRASLSSLPAEIDGWKGTDQSIDEDTLDILGHPEYVSRDYVNATDPTDHIDLFIAYYPSQKAGDTIHSPNHCLPGAGWVPISKTIIQLTRPDGSSFPVNRYVVSKAGERQLALYWFQAHGRAVASQWSAKYYLVSDSIQMNRSDGGLVRLMSMMNRGETPEAAQARILKLGSHVVPLLDSYIPR